MKIVAAIFAVIVFGFAVKNTQEVSLRFFFNYEVRGPLILLLLAFFLGGVASAILGMMPTLFRHRRDLAKHKKAIATMEQEHAAQQLARVQPPQPDGVVNR
ncbi:MAG TPA: LapA family protein [Noviherbaspirillum sp.]|nr:LapA family protein [Noviherbaspirillum sp.]